MLRTKTDAVQAFEVMKVRKPHHMCSKIGEHCGTTHCCQTTNTYCWKETGLCEEKCSAPGASGHCTEIEDGETLVPVHNDSPGSSLFCFSVYFKNKGMSDADDWALDLLRTTLRRGTGIFSCDLWRVYSDSTEDLRPGLRTVQVYPPAGETFATQQRRKCNGGWGCNHYHDTPFFRQVWNKIASEASVDVANSYYSKSWMIKVDPDVVFFPWRLKGKLAQQKVPENGVYIEHCKKVEYGFFGSLEVFSKTAATILFQNVENCYKHDVDWKGERGDKIASSFGWYDEDLFAQICMDLHGVKKVWDFDLVTDSTCKDSRPWNQKSNLKWVPESYTCGVQHHVVAYKALKLPSEYFACLDTATKQR